MGNFCAENKNKEISEEKINNKSSSHNSQMNEQEQLDLVKLSHSENRLNFKYDNQCKLDSYHDIYFRYTPKHLLIKKRIR